MTRKLMFTVDVDRDVNVQIEGSQAAGSLDRGQGTSPRFASTEKGLAILSDMLDDLGIRGTFFIEGRTAETVDCSILSGHCIGFHGYDHEDLTAVDGPRLVMDRGFTAVRDNVSKPVCFRAPYMRTNDSVIDELVRLGIRHDSSVYADPSTQPYNVKGVMEHPVAKGTDDQGKTIAAYLWPMHEGKRRPEDYMALARACGDADLVISTHSWHMVESRDSGPMPSDMVQSNRAQVEDVLRMLMDDGFEPSVICGGR